MEMEMMREMPQLEPLKFDTDNSEHSAGEESTISSDLLADGDPPYQCKVCAKVFAIPARLQRHHRVHTGEKPFKCEFCDKMFSVKENLNVHRRIHTKERPYQCSVCDRAFEHSGKLHRHMRTHTGERPHKCELCGKTFVQSGQLVIHMRAHTGEKPYTCDYCQKGFTCSKQLKVHIRTHTGEKPYECDICGKTFGYNHVLKMHKMSHLGEKLYKCTLCEKFFNSRKALDKHIKDHGQEIAEDSYSEPEIQECNSDLKANDFLDSSTPPHQKLASRPFRDRGNPPLRDKYSRAQHLITHPREQLDERTNLSPGYLRDDISRGFGSIGSTPLTPPRSPDSAGPPLMPMSDPSRSPSESESTDKWKRSPENHFSNYYSYMSQSPPISITETSFNSNQLPHLPQLAFFTTITGERLACPANLLVRLRGPDTKDAAVDQMQLQEEVRETLRRQQELQEHLRSEESRKQRELAFCDSVLKVLYACIGKERMRQLGYPEVTIDQVIMNTLKLMGTQPCWEPSLAPMDRIKVNLRLLLECCVPDKELWDKFGWKGKSIEEIVEEFLEQC